MPDMREHVVRHEKLAYLTCIGYNTAVLAARYHSYGAHVGHVLGPAAALSAAFVLAHCYPHVYARYRTAIVLSLKAAVLLHTCDGKPMVHVQVRLSEALQGGLAHDIFAAFAGLRLFIMALSGMFPLPLWSVWLLQQGILVARTLNAGEDCSTPLLTHPLMKERISDFHYAMQLLTAGGLSQALWLPPQSELGQCRAFVGFWSVLMGLLLPALLLVPRPSREEQRQGGSPRGRQEDQPPPSPRCQRQLDSFEGFVTAGLRGLRYPSSRPMPFLLSWWLTLSLLWFASIGLFGAPAGEAGVSGP